MTSYRESPLPVHPSWIEPLGPVTDTIHDLGDFLRGEKAQGRGFLPGADNILRVFSYPFDRVRVVIVGQDPYPTPGHAMGLAFSVAPTVSPLPKSLINIFKEYCDDLGYPAPINGDLSPWCKQGVALLNRSLTVSPGRPDSHRDKGWEKVTACALQALNDRGTPLVAILWGNKAQQARPLLSNAAIIASPHPSPLSAHRGFFGSRPFSRTNELLAGMHADPIDWRLPS